MVRTPSTVGWLQDCVVWNARQRSLVRHLLVQRFPVLLLDEKGHTAIAQDGQFHKERSMIGCEENFSVQARVGIGLAKSRSAQGRFQFERETHRLRFRR